MNGAEVCKTPLLQGAVWTYPQVSKHIWKHLITNCLEDYRDFVWFCSPHCSLKFQAIFLGIIQYFLSILAHGKRIKHHDARSYYVLPEINIAPEKLMVGRLLSLCDGLFSEVILGSAFFRGQRTLLEALKKPLVQLIFLFRDRFYPTLLESGAGSNF